MASSKTFKPPGIIWRTSSLVALSLFLPVAFAQSSHKQSWTETILNNLSLEQKVGQMIQLRYYADSTDFDNAEYRALRAQLVRYHIGSLVLGMHFGTTGPIRSTPNAAATVANQLQRDSEVPLLLVADFERGAASRLTEVPSFPWPMAFGAIGEPDQVQEFAAVTAREARAVGIQWVLAPVADVNSNAANPEINTRSFGEDPNEVANLVSAFIQGAHANGTFVTAKHFPGSGDVSVDSHRGISSLGVSLEHLQKVEFPPFIRSIEDGVDSIMPAHSTVRALDPDPSKLATVSSKIVRGVLQGQLGFKGLVITDALEMRGLTSIYDASGHSPTARGSVDAIKAGCDVIQLPTDVEGAFQGILESVQAGDITEARINVSVRKILDMKARAGLDKDRFVNLDRVSALTSDPKDIEFAQTIADQSVTLVRDRKHILPITKFNGEPGKDSKLVVVFLNEAFVGTDGRQFEEAIRTRRPDAKFYYFDNRSEPSKSKEIITSVMEGDRVVLGVYVAHNSVRHITAGGRVLNSFGPLGPSGQLLEEIITSAGDKTAVIALGSPYLIVNYPEIQNYLVTYSQTSASEISAAKAIFGEIHNRAKLPVTLPGIAARGTSDPWPTSTSK